MERTSFLLEPVAPFRLDLTAWALQRRLGNAVDRWNGDTYRRVLAMPSGPVEVIVRQLTPLEKPELEVALHAEILGPEVKASAVAAVERLLGLTIDLSEFYAFASHQEKLGHMVERFRGLKPPRLPSVFECVINGIACQQITLTQGIRLLSLLAGRYGAAFEEGDAVGYAFPRPEELASVDPGELRQLGFTTQKSRAIVELAEAIIEGRVDLEALEQLPDEEALKQLQTLRGVGRWTAEYVLLRGLGRTHVFPGDDVGARNNLQRWLEIAGPLDYKEIQDVLAAWKQYGGLIYFHLLLDRLEASGDM